MGKDKKSEKSMSPLIQTSVFVKARFRDAKSIIRAIRVIRVIRDSDDSKLQNPSIRVIRVICENLRFRQLRKIEIDKPVYTCYDLTSKGIPIAEGEAE